MERHLFACTLKNELLQHEKSFRKSSPWLGSNPVTIERDKWIHYICLLLSFFQVTLIIRHILRVLHHKKLLKLPKLFKLQPK